MNKKYTDNKGYTASNLSKGEEVIFSSGPSKWVWIGITVTGLIAITAVVFTLFGLNSSSRWIQYFVGIPGAFISLAFGMGFLGSIIAYYTTEYVVTNKKIVFKSGWIARKTDELLLKKTEGLDVDQSIAGRLLGFGTVSFSGTGSQKVVFGMIDNPLEAKKQIDSII